MPSRQANDAVAYTCERISASAKITIIIVIIAEALKRSYV